MSVPDPSSFVALPPTDDPAEPYSDPEDEVDQLDSDSDTEQPLPKRTEQEHRIPGHSLLPEQRIQSMIQADGVAGNLTLSKEAIFILSVATEEFIKRFTQGAHRQATTARRHTIIYHDMSATTQQYQEFIFLKDTIPAPLSLASALQLREQHEKELVDEDPALGNSSSKKPTYSTSSTKAKSRLTNGTDKPKKQPQQKPPTAPTTFETTAPIYTFPPAASFYADLAKLPPQLLSAAQATWSTRDGVTGILDARPWTNWSTAAVAASTRIPTARVSSQQQQQQNGHPVAGTFSVQSLNGHPLPPLPSISAAPPPAPAPPPPEKMDVDPKLEPETAPPSEEARPSNSPTSTASGPFGSSADNPGRTIYSQQKTPQ